MNFEEGLEVVDEASLQTIGRRLSTVEIAILQGAWAQQTYDEIAIATRYSANYLKRDVGPKLWQSLSEIIGEPTTKSNLRSVLERYYRQHLKAKDSSPTSQPSPSPQPPTASLPQTDWGEAIDVSTFYGRQAELDTLTQWIERDRCRLVAILGMGGMGKTALSVKLAQQLSQNFEFLIWRSLRNAPPLATLLTDVVPFLSNQQETKADLSKLVQCLRQSRCLVIFDNLETLLDAERVGRFRPEFEEYGELLRLLCEVGHQSCVILTSREKPTEVAALEGVELAVRSLRLEGSPEAAQAILQDKGLVGTEAQKQILADRYGNSPLALKIAATSVQELFAGDIEEFLREDTFIFNGVRRLLDQQFQRLTALEQSIMYWLAINRDWTSIAKLQQDTVPMVAKSRLLDALESLSFRCLIEKQSHRFTQQPVVMEYITDALIDRFCAEILSESPDLLLSHALMQAQALDYVKTSQIRLIVQPLLERLHSQCPETPRLTQHMQHLLTYLRQHHSTTLLPVTDARSPSASNYGAGNLLNLYHHLNLDLTGYDFSHLVVLQAYLVNTPLHQVNFTGTTFHKTDWAQSISPPLSLTYSPDGAQVAIGFQDGTIGFWDSSTYQQSLTLSAHQSWTFGIAFSPDGQWLATGSFDRTVKLWQVATGELRAVFAGHPDGIVTVQFSPDGQWLASGGDCGTVKLWNVRTQTCQHTLRWQGGWVRAIAFHPKEPLLITGSDDSTLRIWDLASGDCLKTFGTAPMVYRCLAVHPSGNLLATGSTNHQLQVWDLTTTTCLYTLPAHSSAIWDVVYSPDGDLLASSGDDGLIHLWDANTGQRLKTLYGHRAGVWAIAFDPTGQQLASSSSNELSLRFWSVADGHCLRVIQSQMSGFYRLSYHAATGQLICGGHNYQLQNWDLTSQQWQRSFAGHHDHLWGLAFHPVGQVFASAALDGKTRLWDISSGACLQVLVGHQHWVMATAFHPQGHYLATGGSDQTIRIWDWQAGTCLRILEGHGGFVETLAFHPQAGWLVSGSDDQTLKLWDIETGRCLHTLAGHAGRIWQVVVSPDGQWVASGSDDQTVCVWDMATLMTLSDTSPQPHYRLAGHSASVFGLAFSPDSQVLATGGGDRTIRQWDLATGRCRQVFSTQDSFIAALEFCLVQDSLLLVSGSFNAPVQLWDRERGECVATLRRDRLYEGMTITGVQGLTEAQKATLKQLGAIAVADGKPIEP